MAGLETQWGHYRIVDSHGNVTEGDGWICNNTTTPGHQYVGNEYGDSDYIQEFNGKYGTYYSAHLKPLSGSRAEANAWCIYKGLKAAGWSVEAIAGLCGNIQNESAFSPGRYEGNRKREWPYVNWGCGLTQWTANIKLFNWCKENGDVHVYAIESQIDCINWESLNNEQYGRADRWPFAGEIPQSFRDFRTSTMSPFQLGKAFWFCYERPKDPSEANGNARGRNAEKWYKFFTGSEPPTPVDPTPDPGPQPTGNATLVKSESITMPLSKQASVGNYFSIGGGLLVVNTYQLPDGDYGNINDTLPVDSFQIEHGTLPAGVQVNLAMGSVSYNENVHGEQDSSGEWHLVYNTVSGSGNVLTVTGGAQTPGAYNALYKCHNNQRNIDGYIQVDITVTKKLTTLKLLLLLNKEELPNASNSRLLR